MMKTQDEMLNELVSRHVEGLMRRRRAENITRAKGGRAEDSAECEVRIAISQSLIPNPSQQAMSIQTLYSGSDGHDVACITKLDVISNNLSNMATTAFKRPRELRGRVLPARRTPGVQDSTGQYTPTAFRSVWGAASKRAVRFPPRFVHADGWRTGRGHPRPRLLPGHGSLGTDLYTRAGNFSRNANGNIVVGSADTGRLIQPTHHRPQDAIAISISRGGRFDSSIKQSDDVPGGPDRAGHLHQPARAAQTRGKPLHPNGRLGFAGAGQPRPKRHRNAAANRAGNVERRTGGGADRSDHHAAALRLNSEAVKAGDRNAANRDEPKGEPSNGLLCFTASKALGRCRTHRPVRFRAGAAQAAELRLRSHITSRGT